MWLFQGKQQHKCSEHLRHHTVQPQRSRLRTHQRRGTHQSCGCLGWRHSPSRRATRGGWRRKQWEQGFHGEHLPNDWHPLRWVAVQKSLHYLISSWPNILQSESLAMRWSTSFKLSRKVRSGCKERCLIRKEVGFFLQDIFRIVTLFLARRNLCLIMRRGGTGRMLQLPGLKAQSP